MVDLVISASNKYFPHCSFYIPSYHAFSFSELQSNINAKKLRRPASRWTILNGRGSRWMDAG